MKRAGRILASFAALVIGSGSALAQDWTGPFAGIHTGFGWGHIRTDFNLLNSGPIDATYIIPATGWVTGAHAGFNVQAGPVVFGVVGSFTASTVNGTTAITWYSPADRVSSRNRWLGAIAARAGFAANKVHFYGLIGLGWGAFDHTLTDSPPTLAGPAYTQTLTATHRGRVWGVGVEFAVSDTIALGLEYRRYNFNSATMDVPYLSSTTIFFGDRLIFTPTIHTITATVSFRL